MGAKEDAGAGGAAALCSPAVLWHDAYSPAIERAPRTGLWAVVDSAEPLWAESNWPADMYAAVYPYGAPRVGESLLLLSLGGLMSLLTYAGVLLSRVKYKQAYKRL